MIQVLQGTLVFMIYTTVFFVALWMGVFFLMAYALYLLIYCGVRFARRTHTKPRHAL